MEARMDGSPHEQLLWRVAALREALGEIISMDGVAKQIAYNALGVDDHNADTMSKKVTPDYLYDPHDWEVTWNWQDKSESIESAELDPGELKQFATLNEGQPVYAVRVVKSRDDAGDPDEVEVEWFFSKPEAETASRKSALALGETET